MAQPEVAGFQTFSDGFEFCSFFFCLPPPSISVAPWNSNVPLRLTQVTCLQKKSFAREKNAWKKQCQIKKLRLTKISCHQKEVLLFACLWKWGEEELLRVEAIKAKWFNSPPNFYLNAPTQFFAANVPNKDLEVSHLRQKPHQDLWGHISGGEDQSWKPPLTNSWAFLPPVRNWGSCQDLVLPLHPLGAQGTATTIGVE